MSYQAQGQPYFARRATTASETQNDTPFSLRLEYGEEVTK